MIFAKRRKRGIWVATLCVLLGALLAFQLTRKQVQQYTSGEATEGIVDTLARDVPENHPAVRFTDVAAEVGLIFQHFPATRTNRLPEDMGSGVALGDINGDGWTDAFLVNIAHPFGGDPLARGAGRSRLFQGGPGGQFTDVTESSGIDLEALGNGAAFCDIDNDGDLDLFVAAYGTCHLYSNDGQGVFQDISAASGLEQWSGFWSGVAVGDSDGDGFPEIYVCGYVIYDEAHGNAAAEGSQYGRVIPALLNPSTFEPERNLLLKRGADGRFSDVAKSLAVEDPTGRSLGALFTDINGDGHADIYVANDVSDNAFFVNDGQGGFINRTSEALVGDYRGAMGLAAADFDGDLDTDLFVTHWVAQENALYSQHVSKDTPSQPAIFFDEADRYGLGHKGLNKVGWATGFFDYDNDTDLDLFVVNGHTIPLRDSPTQLEPMRSQLFWQEPKGRGFFHEVGAVSGDFWREKHVGRGGALLDFDLDGDQDILVMLHGAPAVLLRNDGGNAKPAVTLRLRQPDTNRFALGARVLLTAGGKTQMAVVGSQGSYLSQHSVGQISFGLGDANIIQSIEVTWPDGQVESASGILPHSIIDWERGSPPRLRPFPGRQKLDSEGPSAVAAQRHFFELRQVAQEHRLAGRFEQSVAAYQKALGLWPGHGDCLYYLGNMLVASGDEVGALAAFERLVVFEKQSSQGHMQIGFLRLPGGDPIHDDLTAAQVAFARCHELNSEESRPVMMLGVVAMLRGDLPQARKHLLDAAQLNHRSVQARWFAGRVAWLEGNLELAQRQLIEARELARANDESDSKSSEGDTRTGAALTATGGIQLDPMLERWRTTAARSGTIDAEYGSR